MITDLQGDTGILPVCGASEVNALKLASIRAQRSGPSDAALASWSSMLFQLLHVPHGQDARVSAFESVPDQRGASPLRACVLRPVTESNCAAARPGGEQLEVNGQSETQVNSIRPVGVASLLT